MKLTKGETYKVRVNSRKHLYIKRYPIDGEEGDAIITCTERLITDEEKDKTDWDKWECIYSKLGMNIMRGSHHMFSIETLSVIQDFINKTN